MFKGVTILGIQFNHYIHSLKTSDLNISVDSFKNKVKWREVCWVTSVVKAYLYTYMLDINVYIDVSYYAIWRPHSVHCVYSTDAVRVARLTCNVKVMGSSPNKDPPPRCFHEKETLPLLLLVLVVSRYGFKRDLTIKLKQIEGLMEDLLKCQISPLVRNSQNPPKHWTISTFSSHILKTNADILILITDTECDTCNMLS